MIFVLAVLLKECGLDESARFFAVSKSNSNADRNRGKTGVFLEEFIVDKPVAINNIVEEIRKFAINKRN